MKRYTLLISALLAASPAYADHPAGHKVKAQLGSSAAFDRHGVLWLVGRGDHGQLELRQSSDQGQRWSAAQTITHEQVLAAGDERPRIAFGLHDEIYITYSRPLDKPYTSEVRFVRSADGGQHFSAPMTVHSDRQVITHGFASLAVDADGRVYVTWIDKRDLQSARDSGVDYSAAAQYYAVSSDGGISFGSDNKIADHGCECCRSAIALQDGRPVLMWRQLFNGNIRDHAVAELQADGQPPAIQRATFDNWALDACPHQGPSLTFSADGSRHQTWFTGEGLFYAGPSGTPVKLGNEQASNADVAVSGQQVQVVWKEFDGSATHIKAISSRDGGATWQARTLASTGGASGQPRLAKDGARIYLVWSTEADSVLTVAL
ncbi:exo-alpha-sialidase [Pseudoduganella sp. FT55W]|uniref:Exo-alpha-sialidase n=1 Tax=Duganella rivi TaxID=2666083 RepID=A0A7X4GPS5_9BURK|nr:sialidase family protein [Duganella rivi]MYM67323.1 exo-alpha-sialidase [Duganella rivi]